MRLYIFNRKKPLFFWQFIVFLLLLLGASPSIASITINKSLMYFDANGNNKKDVVVYNSGEKNAYVKIDVFEVFNPGTSEEVRSKAKDLGHLKLLVSPNKTMIPPKSKGNIRFSYLGDYEKERIFRVNVTPVVGKIKSEKKMAVKLLVAYQILITVQPNNAKANITHIRQGDYMIFNNDGNTNVLLYNAKLCSFETELSQNCEKINMSKRLYPGNQWEVNVADGQFIEFEMSNGSQYKRTIKRFH